MSISEEDLETHKKLLVEFLKGGFAPNIILLREFRYEKAGVMLDGLHFSAWILLGHIRARHQIFLKFIKNPEKEIDTWPEAFWPENHQPKTQAEWDRAIDAYESELQEMIDIVSAPETDVFKKYHGKTISWAAMSALHHTAYHIGQLKTIGRQLGVW